MSDHKEFDNYIKGLFDKDPKVPSELNWEEMNFDLPDTTNPVEQTNKSGIKKYIGLLLLLLIAVSLIYFGTKKEEITEELRQAPVQLTEQLSEDRTPNTVSETTKQKTQNASASHSTPKQTNPSIARYERDKTRPNPTTHTKKEKALNTSISIALAQSPVTTIKTKSSDADEFINSKEDLSRNFSVNNNTPIIVETPSSTKEITSSFSPIIKDNSTQEIVLQTIENLSAIETSNLSLSSNKNEIELKQIPALSEVKEVKSGNRFKVEEVFVAYGLNNFGLKTDTSNILNEKVNNTIGNSFRMGVRLHLSDNWTANLGAKYDRYHSTFEHTRELEVEYDLPRLVRIYIYEETFHNNYTNTLGIQLGLERRWKIAKQLQLYAGIGITPTYTLSSIGKTTAGTLVDELTYDNQVGKLSMNGGLSAGIIVPINRSINIEAAYQYNKFFLNDIFINKDIHTTQQSTLSLMLSYRLIK